MKALGFDEEKSIEAYLLCNEMKNKLSIAYGQPEWNRKF
jgi:hypothetical protein